MSFGVPMVWREPKGHGNDCYFCSYNVSGFNMKNKHNIQYPNLPSAIRPILQLPVLICRLLSANQNMNALKVKDQDFSVKRN